MKKYILLLSAILPSCLRKAVLKLLGAKIGKNVHLGWGSLILFQEDFAMFLHFFKCLYGKSEFSYQEYLKAYEEFTEYFLTHHNNIGLIRGYSQYLFNVCQKMQMRNIKVNVPLVTTTAEPLMLEQRKIFKEILGAESFDQYGCGEIGGVAFECSEHEGMHITEERVIVEQTNNHDLIMTDLDNYAMPFVRYYNADQAVISNERCGCGREHRLIKQVMGRTCDYVVGMNDEYLHWAYFWHLIFDSGISKKRDLSKFQIEQESQNKIIFKYIAKQLDKDEEKLLTDSIQSKLGNVEVVFSQEHDIPNTATGKYRPVINNLLR